MVFALGNVFENFTSYLPIGIRMERFVFLYPLIESDTTTLDALEVIRV